MLKKGKAEGINAFPTLNTDNVGNGFIRSAIQILVGNPAKCNTANPIRLLKRKQALHKPYFPAFAELAFNFS